MTTAEAVEQLLGSPQLPNFAAQLGAVVQSEFERRQRFYDEITPAMKAEFINGEIIVHSPVGRAHLKASANLQEVLRGYVRRHHLGEVYVEKALVSLTRNDYEPDIVFFSNAKVATFTEDQMKFPAPDLVIEIISPSTEQRDRGLKMVDYAAHGVSEYWLVDPHKKEVEQYKLEGDSFRLALKSGSGEIQSAAIPGFSMAIPAIFDSNLLSA